MEELIEVSKIKKGEILVLGMSTSEIAGEHIGKGRMPEVGEAIIKKALEIAKEHEIYFAAQCCEHLNRAIVVERACMERYGLEEVTVVPVVTGASIVVQSGFAGSAIFAIVLAVCAAPGV